MKDKIQLLNEKLAYLNDGNRKLHGLYDKRGEQIQNLQTELNTCEDQNESNPFSKRLIEGMIIIFLNFQMLQNNIFKYLISLKI